MANKLDERRLIEEKKRAAEEMLAKERAKAARKVREAAEREARERAEREAKERAEREAYELARIRAEEEQRRIEREKQERARIRAEELAIWQKQNKKEKLLKFVLAVEIVFLSIFAIASIVFMFLGSRIYAMISITCAILTLVVMAAIMCNKCHKRDRQIAFSWAMVIIAGISLIYAFWQLSVKFGFTDMTIKDGVLTAYYANEEIVVIPEGVIEIGENAIGDKFGNRNTNNIRQIILPSSVKSIKKGAFINCTSLENISLPEGLETIDEKAFKGCSSLNEINLSESVKVIKTEAFAGCSMLEKVYLGEHLRTIESAAFMDCKLLKSITYNGTEEQWGNVSKAEGSILIISWDKNTGNYEITFLK